MRGVGRSARGPLRVGIILGTLTACSGAPPPTGEVSAAQTAVTSAEEADAAQYAPGDLDRARDKLIRAQSAMQDEDNAAARRLAEQALVDARLAEARARAETARQLRSEAGGEATPPLVTR
jgi:predicted lipid-binding transport protein (Tim44 family)